MSSVFATPSGKILVNQQGHAFTVPYVFGNGLRLDSYLAPVNTNFQEFSLAFWYSSVEYNGIFSTPDSSIRLLALNGTVDLSVGGHQYIFAVPSGSVFVVILASTSDITIFVNNVARGGGTRGISNLTQFNFRSFLGSTGHNYIARMRCFSRVLTLLEIQNIYNNGSGKEPNGYLLAAAYNFSQAEVINSKIAIRDDSGNNAHLYLSNLPGGSQQLQINYINSLIKPFK